MRHILQRRGISFVALAIFLVTAVVAVDASPSHEVRAAEASACPTGLSKQYVGLVDFGSGDGTPGPAGNKDQTDLAGSEPAAYTSYPYEADGGPIDGSYVVTSYFAAPWFTGHMEDHTPGDLNGRMYASSYGIREDGDDNNIIIGLPLGSFPAGTVIYPSFWATTNGGAFKIRLKLENGTTIPANPTIQNVANGWNIYEVEHTVSAIDGEIAIEVINTKDEGSGNDGAIDDIGVRVCAPDPAYDFGDAPDDATGTASGDYRTRLTDAGPRHRITTVYTAEATYKLGSKVTSEPDATPSTTAETDTGDDGATINGNPAQGAFIQQDTATTLTYTTATTNTTKTGYLQAWIDFNRDGDFFDAGERIATDHQPTDNKGTITFTVPADATLGASVMRLRYGSEQAVAPNGDALDGEVEDYGVTISTEAPGLKLTKKSSYSGDGKVGQKITYTFDVENTGNVDLVDVNIDDPKLLLVDLAVDPSSIPTGGTGKATAIYELTQTDIDAGEVVNKATAQGTSPADNTVNVTDQVTTSIPQTAGIELVKTTDHTGRGEIGETINYTFSVKNTGTVTIDNLVIDDSTIGLSDLAVDPDTLAPGETGTATADYQITLGDILNEGITNTATATGTEPNGDEVSDDSDNGLGTGATITPLAPYPELEIIKTGTISTPVNIDDKITYDFTVTNTGNLPLTGVTIDDTALGLDDVAVTPADLQPGTAGTARVTYSVTASDIEAGQVKNTATATGTDPNNETVADDSDSGNPADDSGAGNDPTVTMLEQRRTLELTKTADYSGDGNAGDMVSYTFSVKNTGNITVTSINIDDERIDAINLALNPASLAPGETGTATAKYELTQADIDIGQVDNTATATGTASTGETVTDNGSDDVTIARSPSIQLIKTSSTADSSTPLQAGDPITYTFTVTNTGNVTIDNLTVADPLISSEPIAIQPDALAPGEKGSAEVDYQLTQSDIDNGRVTNSATAVGDDPANIPVTDDSDSGNTGDDTGDTGDPTNTAIDRKPAITVVKSGDGRAVTKPGDEIIYTFQVTNSGNTTLNGVTLNDPLVGISNVSIDDGICDPPDSGADNRPTLHPGQIVQCHGTYAVTQTDIDAQTVQNTADVTATPPADIDGNDASPVTDSDDIDTNVTQNPALQLVKTAAPDLSSPPAAGDLITYTLTVTNRGNVTLTDIEITDEIIGVTDLGIPPGTLAPGEETAIDVAYQITQEDIDNGGVTNSAVATGTDPSGDSITDISDSGDGDPNDDSTSNDDPTQTPILQKPAISVVKTADTSKAHNVGDEIAYRFVITNKGNVTLSDVSVTDTRIATSFSIDQDVCNAPSDGDDRRPALDAGQRVVCTVSYKATNTDFNRGSVTNTVEVSGTPPNSFDGTPADPVTGTSNVTSPLVPRPAIRVAKTGDGSEVYRSGDTVRYTFAVANTGNVTLHDVRLVDEKLGLNILVDAEDCKKPATGTDIRPSLAPQQTVECTALYVTSSDDIERELVENNASVTGNTPPGLDGGKGSPVSFETSIETTLDNIRHESLPVIPTTPNPTPPAPTPPLAPPSLPDVPLPGTGVSIHQSLGLASLILGVGISVLLMARRRGLGSSY